MQAETWRSRWQRRAVTLPVLFLLTGIALALFPLALLLAVLIDLLARLLGQRRMSLTRTLCFFLFLLLCESGGVLFALGLWIRLGRRPRDFELANVRLQAAWCSLLYRIGGWLFSLRTELHGDLPRSDRPLLLLVRHCSTVDTLLPITVIAKPLGLRPRYVLKRELLLDPCIDIVGRRIRNSFVRRGGETASEVAQMLALLKDLSGKDCLVLYPEGTRFSPRKRERLLGKLQGDALHLAQQLKHTLSPLRAGALALVQRNAGADLVVLGHTGLEPAGSLTELLRGGLTRATVHVWLRHIPYEQLPPSESERSALLSELWLELDAAVSKHQAASRELWERTGTDGHG